MELSLRKVFPFFLLTGIILNATGLFTPILEPDGALYAGIAKHIAQTNDWINLYGNGHDWLDKPHFPFWITAFSFKIFGITSFAYKFPAFLFWLIGARFTYVLAKEIYNTTIAQLTVLIYIIALHGVVSNFDVRAEPYLTTLTIGSIYYTYRLYKKFTWRYLLAGALLAACAVMTKGIFILLTVGGGLIIYWMITKQWKQFLNYRWWLLALLIFIFITPELYCLYVQFDLHPEKIVYGQTNVSGLRFFFWDSQFGRFFNTGPIKGSGDPSFFLHTLLWAYLPWSILFYVALIKLILKKHCVKNPTQWIIYGSAGLTFLLFSLSRFQLPHYIIIFFPQLSMIVADDLLSVQRISVQKTLSIIQKILVVLAAGLVIILNVYAELPCAYITSAIAVAILIVSLLKNKDQFIINMLMKAYAFAIIVCLFLNLIFYPFILKYQAGMFAAKWLNEQNYAGRVAMLTNSYSLEFYSDNTIDRISKVNDVENYAAGKPCIIYASMDNIDSLQQMHYHLKMLKQFDYFQVSKLKLNFLNYKTRRAQLQKMALIYLEPPIVQQTKNGNLSLPLPK